MSLRTSDYDFALPDELIARHPLPRREASRMLVLHRSDQRIEHRRFAEFPAFIRSGDLVVLNDTRVVPARAYSDDGRIELLFLEAAGENIWKCLVKPGRKMRIGATVTVGSSVGRVLEILSQGERVIAFDRPIDLEKWGHLPLPPYLGRPAEPSDTERYQTVFAREKGAIAAPTAGLHFTPEILSQVTHAFLTLHVGVGTFRSVLSDDLTGHRMHSERYHLSTATAEAVNRAKRVVAVGTTTTRVLEACGQASLPITAREGATDIFIHPPHDFRIVGAILTNFHLPRSTLLMLVSAFAGRDFALAAYAEAVRERYRFYSYGDCMLIL